MFDSDSGNRGSTPKNVRRPRFRDRLDERAIRVASHLPQIRAPFVRRDVFDLGTRCSLQRSQHSSGSARYVQRSGATFGGEHVDVFRHNAERIPLRPQPSIPEGQKLTDGSLPGDLTRLGLNLSNVLTAHEIDVRFGIFQLPIEYG